MNGIRNALRAWAPLPLRLALGFGLLFHGYPKLFTGEGSDSFAGMLAGIGVPAPGLSAYLIGAFEFFGGILLLLGVSVRVVSALGAVEMVVAAVTVHAPAGFNFLNNVGMTETGEPVFGLPGYEVNVVYLAGFLSLLLMGSGPLGLPSVRGNVEAERTEAEQPASEPEPTHVG